MPKMKTHKATAKRFRKTSKGKLRRMKMGKHLRRNKSNRVVSTTDKLTNVTSKGLRRRVQRLVPTLSKKK